MTSNRTPLLQYDLVSGRINETTYKEAVAFCKVRYHQIENNVCKKSPFLVNKRYLFGKSSEELLSRKKMVTWKDTRIIVNRGRHVFNQPNEFISWCITHPELTKMWGRLVVSLVAGEENHDVSLPDLNGIRVQTDLPDYVEWVTISDAPNQAKTWMAFQGEELVVDGTFSDLIGELYQRAKKFDQLRGFIHSLVPAKLDLYKEKRFQFLDMWFCREDACINTPLSYLPFDAAPFVTVGEKGIQHTLHSLRDARDYKARHGVSFIKTLTPYFPNEPAVMRVNRIGIVRNGVVTEVFRNADALADYLNISPSMLTRRVRTKFLDSGDRWHLEDFGVTIQKL